MEKTPIVRDLKFYENNAKDNFASTPISVLRYITQLEEELKNDKLLKEAFELGRSYEIERTIENHTSIIGYDSNPFGNQSSDDVYEEWLKNKSNGK